MMTRWETRISGAFLLGVPATGLLLLVSLTSGLRAAPWDSAVSLIAHCCSGIRGEESRGYERVP